MNQHYHELTLQGNTGIIVHQATGTKSFTLTLFFVSSPVMNLPKLLRNRSAELSCKQQKAACFGDFQCSLSGFLFSITLAVTGAFSSVSSIQEAYHASPDFLSLFQGLDALRTLSLDSYGFTSFVSHLLRITISHC